MGKNVLIATVGEAPEVLTEVLDKLLEKLNAVDEVLVVYTNDGKVKEGCWNVVGDMDRKTQLLKKSILVWQKGLKQHSRFCDKRSFEQEFEEKYKPRGVSLRPLEPFRSSDINSESVNADFAKYLFSLILKERLAGNTVYISIAGGRKTMSAYALMGALLFGAKKGFHVLVSDEIEKRLRLENKFHVDEVISTLSKEEDKFYALIPIPVPELGPLLSEKIGPEEQISPELLDAKALIDVVNKLAEREKNDGVEYPIFHNNEELCEQIKCLLRREIQKALEERKDCFPRPWECLLVTENEGANPFRDIAEACRERFCIKVCSLTEVKKKLPTFSDTDVIVFDAPAAGQRKTNTTQTVPILRALRGQYPLLPIVCLTQGRDVATSLQLTRAGATACIEHTEAYRIPLSLQGFFTSSLPPNKDIQVHGSEIWDPDGKEEKSLRENLLRLLFPEAEHIWVKRFTDAVGYSSTSKCWVSLDDSLRPYFVKIGSPIELTQEKINYETHVRGHLDNVAGRIEREVAFIEQRAAIAYTVVGLPGSFVQSKIAGSSSVLKKPKGLGDFITKNLTAESRNLLEQLFKSILIAWYNKEKLQPLDPIQAYGHVLPPRLTMKWGQFAQSLKDADLELSQERSRGYDPREWKQKGQPITVVGQLSELDALKHQIQLTHSKFGYKVAVRHVLDEVFASRKLHAGRTVGVSGTVVRTMEEAFQERRLPPVGDPICGYGHPLQAFHELCSRLQQSPQKVKWAPIHGDLNLDNVQTDDTHLWLIDFARTREGPIVFDFAKAEVELKVVLKLQEKYGSQSQFVEFEQGLPDPAVSVSPCADPLASLIASIRQHAFDYCQNPPWDYYLALLVYSLASLKFDHAKPEEKGGKGTAPMLIASATIAGKRALELLGNPAS